MFVILLKFGAGKARAGEFMDGHKAWIQKGFDDGVFLLVGSLTPNMGGGLLASGESRADIEARVGQDPFVAEGIVEAEILEIDPARTDDRLSFLNA
ncbi:YciI family protein [Hwanghaeella sp.]|uniref:YciI family protein n=1 Tax=Hwanghaeella sp. TaxID=2605943 RepID=UPI003CCBB6CF